MSGKVFSPFLGFYNMLWRVARPALRRHKRLKMGFEQRLVPQNWPYAPELQAECCRDVTKASAGTFFDLWLQSASGGEAYLTGQLLRELAAAEAKNIPSTKSAGEAKSANETKVATNKRLAVTERNNDAGYSRSPLHILCTTCTEQGLDVLRKAQAELYGKLEIVINYLPLDEGALMQRAVQNVFGASAIQSSVKNNPTKNNTPASNPAGNTPTEKHHLQNNLTDNCQTSSKFISARQGKLLVLLETELWPSLLAVCKDHNVRTLIVNGRMTAKSFKSYNRFASLLKRLAPQAVLATAQDDLERYQAIFGSESTQYAVMPNIKFDVLAAQVAAPPTLQVPVKAGVKTPDESTQAKNAPAQSFLAPIVSGKNTSLKASPASSTALTTASKLLVLGSVREEEENTLAGALSELFMQMPNLAIAVAPRHMHRVEAWQKLCAERSIPLCMRSSFALTPDKAPAYINNAKDSFKHYKAGCSAATNETASSNNRQLFKAGQLTLWDSFGELGLLYAVAEAVFVGGSLAPLGGQNFLEPLSFGLVPCIGPSWSNFYWVGNELFEQQLVLKLADNTELAPALTRLLQQPRPRTEVKDAFSRYLEQHRNGAKLATNAILKLLVE